MKTLVILNIVLLTAFNSLCQSDRIIFNHNGYIFQTKIESVVDYFHLNPDSVAIYSDILREISLKESDLNYETILDVGGLNLTFTDILRLIRNDESLVKIKRISDGQFIRYKVKLKTIIDGDGYSGMGGNSRTFLTLIDKKKRVQILHEIISVNVAC